MAMVATGHKNALKHGRYTAESLERRRLPRTMVRIARQTLAELDG